MIIQNGSGWLMFWADCVTICWLTSYSPFFMAHSIEAVLPFDIVEATYLLPPLDAPASTEDLIAHHAQQLLKWPEDLCDMADWVLKAHKLSPAQFVSCETQYYFKIIICLFRYRI